MLHDRHPAAAAIGARELQRDVEGGAHDADRASSTSSAMTGETIASARYSLSDGARPAGLTGASVRV